MDISRRFFGAAAGSLGAVALLSGSFAFFWQPVSPDLPGYHLLAYLAGALLVGGAAASQFDRTVRMGGYAMALVFTAFSVPWAIRVVRFPQIFGTWGGFAEEFALVVAAIIIAGSMRSPNGDRPVGLERLATLAFGVCAVAFGINHFTALEQTAGMVPGWLPPGGMFWAVATGIFHAAAGLAILSGIKSELGARLLGCMMLTFGILIWLPNLARSPGVQMTWAGNFVNLALAASCFVVADSLRRHRRHSEGRSHAD